MTKQTTDIQQAATFGEAKAKMPAQEVQFEEVLLGAIMLDHSAMIHLLGSGLKPFHFYRAANELVYGACCRLFEHGEPIDILTVRSELQKKKELDKIDGVGYLVTLTNRIAGFTSEHLELWAKQIIGCYMLREIGDLCRFYEAQSYDDSSEPNNLLEALDRDLTKIHQQDHTNSPVQAGEPAARLLEKILEYKANPNPNLLGVNTGIKAVDTLLMGSRGGDFVIIAGRPAMGKTAFALQLANHCASEQKKPVAIFSLEMTEEQMSARLMSSYSGVNGEKFRRWDDLSESDIGRLRKAQEWLDEQPIYIVEASGLSPMQMRVKARELYRRHGLGAVIVDYLQLMSDESNGHRNGNREQEISRISRGCKTLANELNIPVFALSQLNRSVEIRGGNKKPMLSDLRESGSLEQDADTVMFMYRPEYYDVTEDEEGNSTKGIVEGIIAKNRHGKPGTAVFKMNLPTGSFYDLGDDPTDYDQPEPAYNPSITVPAAIDTDDVIPF